MDSPEHDWARARDLIYPAFRPVGTQGLSVEGIDRDTLVSTAVSHSQPILDEGPAGLPVVYTIDAGAFDVVVNGDHLLSWGIGPAEIQDAALANLARWSAAAPWTEEVSGERRLVSSDTGHGWDAARILLPEVVDHLVAELGPHWPDPDRGPGAPSPGGPAPFTALATTTSRCSSPTSSSSIRAARTSRSIGASSSSSTGGWSSSSACPRPDRHMADLRPHGDRRRGRDHHPGSAGRAQRADHRDEGGSCSPRSGRSLGTVACARSC